MDFGYVRVSCKTQHEDRQKISMQELGIAEERIYVDKKSGKDFDRPEYIRLMKELSPGDTLYIKSIDRLGRNYKSIIEEWQRLSRKNVYIVILDMPMLDTRPKNETENLTTTFLCDMVLQILSYVAQTEREYIKQRQREGIAAAKAKGKTLGRKKKKKPENFIEVYNRWQKKEISSRQAGELLGVSHTTFLNWAKNKANSG